MLREVGDIDALNPKS